MGDVNKGEILFLKYSCGWARCCAFCSTTPIDTSAHTDEEGVLKRNGLSKKGMKPRVKAQNSFGRRTSCRFLAIKMFLGSSFFFSIFLSFSYEYSSVCLTLPFQYSPR